MQSPALIITGASAGIGRAIAERLAEPGVRLLLVARRAERLRALQGRLQAAGAEVASFACDLAELGAATAVVGACVEAFGSCHGLINNAGLFKTCAAEALDRRHVEAQLQINLIAPMLLCRAAIPVMRASGGGDIVNISSIAAQAHFAGCAAYAASKAGLEAYSGVLREELRADRIRVGVVVPGATDSEIWPEDCPFERTKMCRSEDIAAAVTLMLQAPASTGVDRIVVTPAAGSF